MFKYPKALESLIESLTLLPSVGRKTAERYALAIINDFNDEDVEELIYSLKHAHENVHTCKSCGCLTDEEICSICSDDERNKRLIMVVEQAKDVFILEKLEEFKGIYHVLNGAISYAKGIMPNDLNIESLVEKVNNNLVDEIIIACNATLEGEATALYLRELFKSTNIKISRIAYGLPVGSDLSYIDQMTLLKALEGRVKYE